MKIKKERVKNIKIMVSATYCLRRQENSSRGSTIRVTTPGAQVQARCKRRLPLLYYLYSSLQDRDHTFFLFSSLPLVTYFNSAYAQNYSNDEKEYPADDTSGNGLVLDPSRYWKLHLLANCIVCCWIRDHLEVVRSATNQVFHCGLNNNFIKSLITLITLPTQFTVFNLINLAITVFILFKTFIS